MVHQHKQQGMAMLMALVLLAIASSLAVAIWYDNQLSIARINNVKNNYQAKHYSQGLLLWASDLLREDYAQDEYSHDSALDGWHQGIRGMVVEDALLSGTLVGLNGRFNVNNLVINGLESPRHIAYFKRLLLALELDVNLADKAVDWIDADQVPLPNGAEDFAYLAKSPSYQTSGKPFKHISELALLDGLSAENYQRLVPYVTVLPVLNQATYMNVNTMSPVMLNALDPKITKDMAMRLYQNGSADYLQVDGFFQDPSIQYALPPEVQKELRFLISTQTRYLQASSLVQMEGSNFVMYALLYRDATGRARVLNRSLSPYLPQALVN